MKKIPNYALYGESAGPSWNDLVHVEWMPDRSQALGGEIKAHHHDALMQLVYAQRGHGEVLIENHRQHFQAPCLILLPCRTVHAFNHGLETYGPVITAAQRPLESMIRIVAPELLVRLQRPVLIPLPAPMAGNESFWPVLMQLVDEVGNSQPGHMAAALALLVALLLQIDRLVVSDGLPVGLPGRHSSLQQGFRELVEQHFRQHWPLDLYAQRLGISQSKLARICREELGEPPLALINSRLMREAQRQLAYSEAGIKQIAHDLGFSDLSYFSRYFRKQSGVRPSEFRAAFHRQRLLGQAPVSGVDGAQQSF